MGLRLVEHHRAKGGRLDPATGNLLRRRGYRDSVRIRKDRHSTGLDSIKALHATGLCRDAVALTSITFDEYRRDLYSGDAREPEDVFLMRNFMDFDMHKYLRKAGYPSKYQVPVCAICSKKTTRQMSKQVHEVPKPQAKSAVEWGDKMIPEFWRLQNTSLEEHLNVSHA